MRPRFLVLLSAAGMLAVGTTVGPSVADRVLHPRDEDGFQTYVVTYMLHPGTQQDEDWAEGHPDEILAAGDRACGWLSRQEPAPDIDPSGATTVHHLVSRYLRDVETPSSLHLTRYGHATVVYGAWEYLCQPERRDKSAPESEDED